MRRYWGRGRVGVDRGARLGLDWGRRVTSATGRPAMPKVLILTGDAAESLEVMFPYQRLLEEGYEVHIAAPPCASSSSSCTISWTDSTPRVLRRGRPGAGVAGPRLDARVRQDPAGQGAGRAGLASLVSRET